MGDGVIAEGPSCLSRRRVLGPSAMVLAGSRNLSSIPRRSPARRTVTSPASVRQYTLSKTHIYPSPAADTLPHNSETYRYNVPHQALPSYHDIPVRCRSFHPASQKAPLPTASPMPGSDTRSRHCRIPLPPRHPQAPQPFWIPASSDPHHPPEI